MSLINTYEEYKALNKELISFTEKVMLDGFENQDKREVLDILNEYLQKFEAVKEKTDELVVEEDNITNLRDLQYMIVSGLFLISELIHFYSIGEFDRFKMRAVNYINNNRRNEMKLR